MRSPTRSRLRSVVLAVSMAAIGTPAVVIAAGVARGAASSYSEAPSMAMRSRQRKAPTRLTSLARFLVGTANSPSLCSARRPKASLWSS